MKRAYERTLFQRAKIERFSKSEAEFDANDQLIEIATNVSVGLAQKAATQSAMQDGNGNVKVQQYFLLHTLFSGIQAGDTVTVTDVTGYVLYGRFRAAKPYPVMDTKGIHHYEVFLYEDGDA